MWFLLLIKYIIDNEEGVGRKYFEMENNQYEQLNEEIIKIESRVVDLTSPNDLRNVDVTTVYVYGQYPWSK